MDTSKLYNVYAQARGSTQWNRAPRVLLVYTYDKQCALNWKGSMTAHNLLCDFVIEEIEMPKQELYPN